MDRAARRPAGRHLPGQWTGGAGAHHRRRTGGAVAHRERVERPLCPALDRRPALHDHRHGRGAHRRAGHRARGAAHARRPGGARGRTVRRG